MGTGRRSAGQAGAAAGFGEEGGGFLPTPFVDDPAVQGVAPAAACEPPLRAGDRQCGALPAAAEALCRAGGGATPAAERSRLTPVSSSASTSSAVQLRMVGSGDGGPPSARFSPMQTPTQVTPNASSDEMAAAAAAAVAAVAATAADPRVRLAGKPPPLSPFAAQADGPEATPAEASGSGSGYRREGEECLTDEQRAARRAARVLEAKRLDQVPSLSERERALYREISDELASEGELSSLLSGLRVPMSSGGASGSARSVATAPPVLTKEASDVVDRLRAILPQHVVSRLQTYDSYGLVDVLHSQGVRQAARDAVEAERTCAGAPLLGTLDPDPMLTR